MRLSLARTFSAFSRSFQNSGLPDWVSSLCISAFSCSGSKMPPGFFDFFLEFVERRIEFFEHDVPPDL